MTQTQSMKEVFIYTDGACQGNPGPGGYAFISTTYMYLDNDEKLRVGDKPALFKVGSGRGREAETTNNRMELMAVILALESNSHNPGYTITVVTDSKYVLQGMTEWIKNWKTNNWVGSNKKPVRNQDLWTRLDRACSKHPTLKWKWIKGHSGDIWNEAVDKLAVEAISLYSGVKQEC